MQNNNNQTFEFKQRKYKEDEKYPKSFMTYKDGGINMAYKKNPIGPSIVANVFKQISSKLMTGQIKNINAISKPTKLCHDITFAQIVALDNNSTQYLDLAAQTNDPVQRMQFVVTYLISTIHCAPQVIFSKIPIDSVIGETVQYEKKNGTKYYAECVSTNPSAIQVYMVGPHKSWTLKYQHKVDAKLALPKMNDLDASAVGYKIIEFPDGTEIKCENMELHIGNILIGDRYMKVQNHMRLLDKKNSLQAHIDYEYQRTGTIMSIGKSLHGWWSGSSKGKIRDPEDFIVKIYKYTDGNQNILAFKTPFDQLDQKKEDSRRNICSQGTGNYISYIQFDGELLWQIDDVIDQWQMCTDGQILQSDASLRKEVDFIKDGDYDNAEKHKNQSEEQDRQDQKLRSKNKK